MTKQEILRSDRFTQLAVAAAAQAVEESGVIGTVDPARIGVYFGSGIGGINTMTKEHAKLLNKGPARVSPYCVPMMIANMAAGEIGHPLQLPGRRYAGCHSLRVWLQRHRRSCCVRFVTATPTLSSPAVRMRLSTNSAWQDS